MKELRELSKKRFEERDARRAAKQELEDKGWTKLKRTVVKQVIDTVVEEVQPKKKKRGRPKKEEIIEELIEELEPEEDDLDL